MGKLYEDWNLYDFEKQIKKDSFISFLEYVFENDGMSKVIEILKASGYFISYRDKVDIGDEQKIKIDNFINSRFSEKGIRNYKNLKKEACFLLEKRNVIEDKILNILKKGVMSYEILVCVVLAWIDNLSKNKKCSNEQKIATREYYVMILGTLLKINMHNEDTDSKTKNILSVEDHKKLLNYTFMYREMNEIIQSWMFGDTKIEKDEFLEIEELPGNNEDRVISASNYWDIKEVKNIKAHLSEFEKTGSWQENLEVYNTRLEESVKEDFYTQDFQEEYLGIPLYKWMTVYKFFAEKSFESKEPILKIQRSQLIAEMCEKGLAQEEAEEVLKKIIFGKKSTDLFDSFLVEQNGELLFSPIQYLFIDNSKAMISLFGKDEGNDTNVEQKGQSFEHHIYMLLKENFTDIERNISMNYKDEEYEIDLAVVLEGNLFICECKTQYQHENMRGYYRNLNELDNYLKKFERNYKFFVENEEGNRMLKQRLNIQSYNNIYPIFISNIVFMKSKINDIYITDEPRIYRYMKRTPENIQVFDNQKKTIKCVKLFSQFYEGQVTAAQFIDYLNNKSNELEFERKKIILTENPTLREFGIVSKRYMENKSILENYYN